MNVWHDEFVLPRNGVPWDNLVETTQQRAVEFSGSDIPADELEVSVWPSEQLQDATGHTEVVSWTVEVTRRWDEPIGEVPF